MKENFCHKTIFTIGHSTHTLAALIGMLHSFQIKMVVDIRRYPGSRRYPQFDKTSLEIAFPKNGIQYLHIEELGGRRKAAADSKNTIWRHAAFRGYADYMETGAFTDAITELEKIGARQLTAYLCSEAVWWRCHRSMVSDFLKSRGWKVMHIMGVGKAEEHPYTAPAKIENGRLTYKVVNIE